MANGIVPGHLSQDAYIKAQSHQVLSLILLFCRSVCHRINILHTYGIYTRSEIPLVESGAKKVLSWNNLSIKTPGTIYAACYNTKDGAYLLSGTVNEKGTAVFFDFRLHEATNVSIFTLE